MDSVQLCWLREKSLNKCIWKLFIVKNLQSALDLFAFDAVGGQLHHLGQRGVDILEHLASS